MKPHVLLFALVALVPAATNAGPALALPGGLMMPICSGDGQVRMVPLPGGGEQPAPDNSPCCTKACHSGSSRKRLARNFAQAQ